VLSHSGIDDLKLKAYKLENYQVKTEFKTLLEFDILIKFECVYKDVVYEKIKDFVGDFSQVINSKKMKESAGIAGHFSDFKVVKQIDEKTNIF